MKIKLTGIFILFFLISTGQETTKELYKRLDKRLQGKLGDNTHKIYPKFSMGTSYGKNLVSGDTKELFEKPNYLSLDFRVSYQSTGKNIYDELWRYPEWGIAYYGTKLYNDEDFGVPNAVFAYIDVPFNKWNPKRKWTYSYSLGGGMSYNFRPNNPQSNPINVLIGSYNNVYIDIAFWANRRLNNSFDAKFGLSYVHFSNGASTLPNMGMNLIGPKVILQHNVTQERPNIFTRDSIPTWKVKHGISIYQAMGSKQLEEHGKNYFNSTTSVAYKYWNNYKGRWIGQLDFFYDSSANSGEKGREEVPLEDRDNAMNAWSVGIYAGYEAVYNRFSFESGWGVYAWRRYEFTSPFYQRVGVRYRLYDGLAAGVCLKARTFAADYIEWSLTYNIF